MAALNKPQGQWFPLVWDGWLGYRFCPAHFWGYKCCLKMLSNIWKSLMPRWSGEVINLEWTVCFKKKMNQRNVFWYITKCMSYNCCSMPAKSKNCSSAGKEQREKNNKNYPSLKEILGKEMKDSHLRWACNKGFFYPFLVLHLSLEREYIDKGKFAWIIWSVCNSRLRAEGPP